MARGNSFLGSIFIGIILFIVSFFVLFINEFIYVNSLKIADFAEKMLLLPHQTAYPLQMRINLFTSQVRLTRKKHLLIPLSVFQMQLHFSEIPKCISGKN